MKEKVIIIRLRGEVNQTRLYILQQQLRVPNALCGYNGILVVGEDKQHVASQIRVQLEILEDKLQ